MRQKEINALKARLARLEAAEAKAEMQRERLATAFNTLQENLKEAGLPLSAFVSAYYKEIKKVITRIENKNPGLAEQVTRKKAAKTVSKRRRKRKAKTVIKIPAGRYSNVPADPEKVFEVKEKGPRPKLLKAYAEEVGQEAFLQQCRVGD